MKLKLVIFFIIFFSVPMVSEEWEIEVTDNNVLVSIPGNIMHGDKYRIILVPENQESCDIANQYISNYALVDQADQKYRELPSQFVLTEMTKGSEKVNFLMEIVSTHDFLLGKSTFFNVSSNSISDLVDFHKNNEKIELKLLDFYDLDKKRKMRVNITEYFDIPKNSWDLNGFEIALKDAKLECLKLVDSIKS